MRLRTLIVLGLAVRLAIAPFLAHPVDVYASYVTGEQVAAGNLPLWDFLRPYTYSYYLSVFPSTYLYNALAVHLPNASIPMSAIDPRLNPGAQWGVKLVPGLLYDLLLKLPYIASDALIASLLYWTVKRHFGGSKDAILVASIWFMNPLTIWISSGWGMFDTLAALFTVLSMYLLLEKRIAPSAVSLVLAIAMKYYALVLIIPFLLLAWRIGGRRGLIQGALYASGASALMFLPLFGLSASYLGSFVVGPSPVLGVQFPGLSLWTPIVFAFPSFDLTRVSPVLAGAAIVASYVWMWRRGPQDATKLAPVFFVLPTLLLLLFYRAVAANFLIWVVPFIALLSLRDRRIWYGTLLLSIVGFLSSLTDSLLPYYLLPVSPWIGSFLVEMLNVASPYRIAPGGQLVSGFTLGKAFLAVLGALASSLLILLSVRCLEPRFSELKLAIRNLSAHGKRRHTGGPFNSFVQIRYRVHRHIPLDRPDEDADVLT